MSSGTLIFDVETHSADLLYTLPPEQFVRLAGYKWAGDDTVTLTTDVAELREQIRRARWIIGHNIHSFDLPAVFGPDSNEPLQLAAQRRVYDTWTHAVLVNPAPSTYVNRYGKNAKATKPEELARWFGLDEQAHQLGVPGKTHDLNELAREYGDLDLKGKVRVNDGYGRIPVDDERYRDYLCGDVRASEAVARALLRIVPLDEYAMREQEIEARKAVIQANGFHVDTEAAQARRDELAERREKIMADLVERYDFPTEGKAPWATTEGKEAIFKALADQGITPQANPDWDRTATGNPSLGGDTLIRLTRGTAAEDLGAALAELKGQRSLSQLALDSTHADGFAHPGITMLQRSGRWSTTNPGLTIWTARGEGAVEKRYFIPDTPEHVLLEIDYSNADARFVAAVSGDRKYAERFEPGADGHLINAIAAWGEDVVLSSPEAKAEYRQKAKPLGHGWSYGGQANTLSRSAGVPLKDARQFCDGMAATYHVLVAWQNYVRRQARTGCVVNDWGRKMWVEKGREFTQAPALIGQSGTREIVCDALLRMPVELLRCVKAQVHDALLFSVPREQFEQYRDRLCSIMETTYRPKHPNAQTISFPVEAGPPGDNWHTASH